MAYPVSVGEQVTLRVPAGAVDATFDGCPFPTFDDLGAYTFNRLQSAPPYRLLIPGETVRLVLGPTPIAGLFLTFRLTTFGDLGTMIFSGAEGL